MTRHAIADARMATKSQPVKEDGNSRCHDPSRESIVVEYRGYWFHIDERDQKSLSTYTWLVEPPEIEREHVVLLSHGQTGRIDASWAVHQVDTTVDFARENRVLSRFIGGLNFQIEHHLFPRICHIHYRRLAPLVETTCREFGVNYEQHKSFSAAVMSHFRWLRGMGME